MNKEEIKDIKQFFSKEFIEYLQEGENTATEISIKTIMQTKEYIEQLENKVKEVEAQRNKLATELSDKEDEKQELIKYITEYKNEVVKKKEERINLHLTESVELNALEKFFKEILNQIKGEKEC